MSAARTGVSAVASSSEVVKAPAKASVFMAVLLPSGGRNVVAPADIASFLLEPEHVQHGRGRGVLELGCILQDVERLLRADQHRDVLLAVDRVAYRGRVDAGARVVAP